MTTMRAEIRNSNGIHVRPSQVISSAAAEYAGSIQIESSFQTIFDANTISIISLGLIKGDIVHITVEGPDEHEFCRELANLFERKFDFPPRQTEIQGELRD